MKEAKANKTISPDTAATFLALGSEEKKKLKIAAALNWNNCRSMTEIIEKLINENIEL